MSNKLLDIFKFVACLFVVAIHARPLMICGEDADWALTSLCRWAVPLFFASSSYLFWSRNKQYKDFTVRLLILTGAWMVLGGYFIWERFFMHGMTYGSLVDFVKALFFSNVVSANWFITALIESMGIVWLLRKLGNKVLLLIASVCYCLSLSYGLYYPIACELVGGGDVIEVFASTIPPANSFVVAMIYVVIGKIVADSQVLLTERQRMLYLFGVMLAILMGGFECWLLKDTTRWVNDAFLALPILTFCLLKLITGINCEIPLSDDVCRYLRSSSILIYLSHPFMIRLGHLYHYNCDWKLYIFAVCASVAFSIAVISLSKKIKILRYLY